MKFGEVFTEYLEERELHRKSVHIEYKQLKKVLKKCKNCKELHSSSNSELSQEQLCECPSCPLCDQKFFSELMKEAADISGYFSSRVRHLLHLHIASGMQRYVFRWIRCFKHDRQALAKEWKTLIEDISMNAIAIRKILKKYDKVHSSVNGENFKSRMQANHIELLHPPWLIELGALYLNCNGPDGIKLKGIYGQFSCDLNMADPEMILILPDSIRLEFNLKCAICLDVIFHPYALGCGHLFCKSCACSAASVMIFQGLKAASPDSKCPVCREIGVYSKAIPMKELYLLLKRRYKEYYKDRMNEERCDKLKQSKEYWTIQTSYAVGLM